MTSPASLPPFVAPAGAVSDDQVLGASNAIRRYCGWHIAPRITQTFVINEPGQSADIFIPSLMIHAVTACTVTGVDLTEDQLQQLDWSSNGYIGRGTYGGWPTRRRSVTITVDHGYDLEDVPELAMLCKSLAERVASRPAGIVRQQVGQRNEEYERAMLGDDRTALDLYRIVGR